MGLEVRAADAGVGPKQNQMTAGDCWGFQGMRPRSRPEIRCRAKKGRGPEGSREQKRSIPGFS